MRWMLFGLCLALACGDDDGTSDAGTDSGDDAAVDTGTERLILDALQQRKGRQTTIVIAHRLSSVTHADRILVLEHGRLSQLGTHEELASQAGTYRRLCEIQGALDAQIAEDLGTSRGQEV